MNPIILLLKKVKRVTLEAYRLVSAPLRKDPDFLIIGVQKGGTTSLFHYLSQHPDMKLTFKKEVHFFDKYYHKGLRWYKSHFPLKGSCLITGEASPEYIYFDQVAERVKHLYPNIKIILLLRNPIDRAQSHFNHNKKKHKGDREPLEKFEEALALEDERIQGKEVDNINGVNVISYENWHYSYLRKGDYAAQLQNWLTYFDSGQIFVRSSEEFFSDPKSVLSDCYDFLGINQFFPKDMTPKNINRRKGKSNLHFNKNLTHFLEHQIAELGKMGYWFSNWINENGDQ